VDGFPRQGLGKTAHSSEIRCALPRSERSTDSATGWCGLLRNAKGAPDNIIACKKIIEAHPKCTLDVSQLLIVGPTVLCWSGGRCEREHALQWIIWIGGPSRSQRVSSAIFRADCSVLFNFAAPHFQRRGCPALTAKSYAREQQRHVAKEIAAASAASAPSLSIDAARLSPLS
jgi:hypothetical protein